MKQFQKLRFEDNYGHQIAPVEPSTKLMKFGTVLVAAGLILALLTISVTQHSQATVLSHYTNREAVYQQAPRGLFYDTNGVRLVANTNYYQLQIVATDDVSARKSLNSIAGEVNANLKEAQIDAIGDQLFRVNSLVNNDQKILLEENIAKSQITNYSWTTVPHRHYYYSHELAHIIGYTADISPADLERGYRLGDRIGRYGLEQLMEERLKGIDSETFLGQLDSIESLVLAGNNITLTIDIDQQRLLYKLLAKYTSDSLGAAAVLLKADSGDLIANVNYPSFDANSFDIGISSKSYSSLQKSSKLPLLDKTVGLQAAPGSIFKLFGAFSLLDNSIITANDTFLSEGCTKLGASTTFCEIDHRYLGNLKLREAIARSSNIFFCKSMLKMSEKGLLNEYIDDLAAFGFGEKTDGPFGGEVSGSLASPAYKKKVTGEGWYPGDTCNTVIGQGFTVVTPMQLAYGVAALVNGGNYYKPNYIKLIQGPEGEVRETIKAERIRKINVSKETAHVLQDAMSQTVYDSLGSAGSLANLDNNYNLRVKTGSTEAQERVNNRLLKGIHSWVVAVYDHKGETYVLVIFQRFGGRSYRSLPVVESFLKCLPEKIDKCL